MTVSPGRFPWTAVLSAVLLVALFELLFFAPLAPTAWGGPRGEGPFETETLPAAGRWARDARLVLEAIAKWRSPSHPLEATAEALAGWHALLAAARYALLWLILRRLGGCSLLATVGVVAAAALLKIHGVRRTDTDVGLVFFVILMAATTLPRMPWWVAVVALPVLFVFWANAHMSAIVGLGWLGVVTAGRLIEWWRLRLAGADRPEVCPHVGRLIVASALCAAALCANPDGPRIFVEFFQEAKNPSVGTLPAWQPTDFSKPAGMPWVYFASIATIFVVQLISRRALSPLALIVILTFGIWPLVQQRGADYWWLIVPWILMPQVASFWNRSRPAEPEASARATGNIALADASGSSICCRWLIVAACAIAVIATPAARWFVLGSPRSLKSIVSRDTPARLAFELTADEQTAGTFLPDLREQLRATYPNGKYRGAILGGLDQGDFLAWVLDGDNTRPIMIYTRPLAIGRDHWAECQKVLDGESSWWEITGRHQVNLIAIDPGRHEKLAERLRAWPEWRTVQDEGPGGLLVSVRQVPKLPAELTAP